MSQRSASVFERALHHAGVSAGAILMTLLAFLVLPLIQAITKDRRPDRMLRGADTVMDSPEEEVEEEEIEEEIEEEPPPPDLAQEQAPLDLSQLELAMGGASGSGWGIEFAIDLDNLSGLGAGGDSLLDGADLDQKPRAIYQVDPVIDARVRKRVPGWARVVFAVDERGRVQQPQVLDSSDPVFERPAIGAVKQWRFEPGKKKGEAVSFRMRVTVEFPE